MEEYYTFRISKESLESHVKRICRSNLKHRIKICRECPFLGQVIGIMDSYGWKYNEEWLKDSIDKYKAGKHG